MLPQDKSLRILHILNHSLPIYDGYTFRSHNIVQAQQKKGWHPLVLTSPKYEEYWKGAWQPIEVLDGICHYRTGPVSSHALPFATEIHLMQALARRLREVIKLETPTLLHAHSPILNAIPALWVGCREGIPAVYEMRASWEDAGVDHGTYQHDSVCRRARQVAVLCEGLKKGLMQRGIPSDKLTVVPNGVNVDHMTRVDSESEFKQRWNLDGKKIVGFIGSFYRYEGLELFVEAMGLLCSKRDDVVLLLVGTGEMEAVLNAQIANSNLGDLVIMPGKVPHDRIPEIYSLIDILVYPRYSMRLTELVTPLKPLEAMCMEKALVASNVGGHRELIQDGFSGVLFPAGDAVALANTLHRLLDDHVLRRTLGEQAAEWVRRERSWEKTTSVYLDIYSRVL